MKRFLRLRRPVSWHQQVFPFLARSEARTRWFKRGILLGTLLLITLLLEMTPQGRYVVASLASEARRAARFSIGVPTPRSEVDARWQRFRLLGIGDSRRALEADFATQSPSVQRLMNYAGLDPRTGLLRWGNYNRTMLLPSTVFEGDDTGRSYRLRPLVRSVWLRNISMRAIPLTFFLVPDGPELRSATEGTSAILVDESRQMTNSWGLRGGEPDPAAPLRGIVLGDSFMQGLFLPDDQTPSEHLRRHLDSALKTRASILNTGHLGYSPEQYYFTLLAFADRFRPQFVVVSVFANDFGDIVDAVHGHVDWEEGNYWLNQIAEFCRLRSLTYLFVTVPLKAQIVSRRAAGFYPGRISDGLETNGIHFLNPIEAFVNAHLVLMNQARQAGAGAARGELFNDHLSDGHFSALGADLWGRAVAERLAPLLKCDDVIPVRTARRTGPRPRPSSRATERS
jgi:hypothetical protein